jgi:hypothetical protein
MLNYTKEEKEKIIRGNLAVLKDVLSRSKDESIEILTYTTTDTYKVHQGYVQLINDLQKLLS